MSAQVTRDLYIGVVALAIRLHHALGKARREQFDGDGDPLARLAADFNRQDLGLEMRENGDGWILVDREGSSGKGALMSAPKHTPEPWIATWFMGFHGPDAEANAILSAAAPDLAAALEARRAIDRELAQSRPGDRDAATKARLEAALAHAKMLAEEALEKAGRAS